MNDAQRKDDIFSAPIRNSQILSDMTNKLLALYDAMAFGKASVEYYAWSAEADRLFPERILSEADMDDLEYCKWQVACNRTFVVGSPAK